MGGFYLRKFFPNDSRYKILKFENYSENTNDAFDIWHFSELKYGEFFAGFAGTVILN